MATQDFKLPEDIANRALQILGATRIASFSEASKNASAVLFAYDKLRKAELRRNLWRFSIKRCILRPITVATATFTPSVWDIASPTYAAGALTQDSTGDWWQAKIAHAQTTPSPAQGTYWRRYSGPDAADPWDYSGNSTYYAGEIVLVPANWSSVITYALGSLVRYTDGKYYVALQGTNLNNIPSTATTFWMLYQSWASSTILSVVPLVYPIGHLFYLSISSNNIQNPSSSAGQWITLSTSVATPLQIIYPIGAGPAADLRTNNVFRLPRGYLRQAPDDPKANLPGPSLGAVLSPLLDDYVWEDNYIVSALSNLAVLRYVSDFVDVAGMDPMFCEGLANRMAEEICEELNQDTQKVSLAIKKYAQIMWEARLVNAIEQGAAEPALDTYISCRF